MPKLTVSRHGLTAAIPPRRDPMTPIGGLRGEVAGWSQAATRRNTGFLRTIDERKLSGAGVALTLTLRECPPTPQAWHALRKAWIERMRRAGMVRLHWVTEWQRRGVPHLHCALWFPDAYDIGGPLRAWVELAEKYGAGLKGQHGRMIDGPVGWFQYLSKHAARGVKHYQRSSDSIPPAWKQKTGRVWGHSGEWVLQAPIALHLEGREGDGGYFAFRRLVRSWRVADARSSGDLWRLRQARQMLQANNRPASEVRPVSEWVSQAEALMFLGNLAERGYLVRQWGAGGEPPADDRT